MRMRWPGSSGRRCRYVSYPNRRRGSSHACSEADVGLLALFRRTPTSANVAKERLRIIVAQERSDRSGPDYMPLLRRELLEVIRKYVNVDPGAVQVNVEREHGQDILELSVALPQRAH